MNHIAINQELDRVYRQDFARLLAVLTRIFGAHNYDLAEDVLQESFNKALTHWAEKGLPENPSAWLMRVAKNHALDVIRANKTRLTLATDLTQLLESEWSLQTTIEFEFNESNIHDDQLRMIFMCCREDITPENQLPLILRSLCGFSIPAIANALLISEATVKKRLLRTRAKLKSSTFELPSNNTLSQSMTTVHTALYLLFNEGFHSVKEATSSSDLFCQEALGLARLLLSEHRIVNKDTFGLVALMHFHLARLSSRVKTDGTYISMDKQDRSLWDTDTIQQADQFLSSASAVDSAWGRYYIEALIAREHCVAATFEDTNWGQIVELYKVLVDLTQSPLAELNHAIALGYSGQLDHAIQSVETLRASPFFKHSYAPTATLAHLKAKKGEALCARKLVAHIAELGASSSEQMMVSQQVESILKGLPTQN